MSAHDTTRRELLKKAMYVPPTILTLAALPSFASAGSGNDASAAGRSSGGEEERRGGDWWDFLEVIGIK